MTSSGRYVLAFDQGTTSSRSILFDRGGNVVAVDQKELPVQLPQPGWVEQDPAQIWAGQATTATQVIASSGIDLSEVAAVGICNQRETTLVWERRTGRPIYPAIVWQDRRTADRCAALRAAGVEAMVTAKTGLRIDPYFSATKLEWILAHVAGARRAAEAGELCFGTVDTWLLWQLTGGTVHATDVTNASRTLLFNIHTGTWDDALLERFGVPRSMLPAVQDSSGKFCEISALPALRGVPVTGVAGDQQAALFGQACFEPGMAKNTYGTGCFLLLHTGSAPVASRNNLLTTPAWRIGGVTEYALEGAVFVAGALFQWLRDEMEMVADVRELDALAASVPDAGGVSIVPAFAGLGAPHWDAFARGTIVGITRGTKRAHFCRAALDAIAFQTADLVHCMEKDSGVSLRQLRVDGGASRSAPLLQIQADVLGADVIRPANVETSAAGAAFLAGLAVGVWRGREEIAGLWRTERIFHPAATAAPARAQWDQAVAAARAWSQGRR